MGQNSSVRTKTSSLRHIVTGKSSPRGYNNANHSGPMQQHRVIMLGTGGVGKSTIFKNIKLLFNGGFDSDEYLSYREVILSNIVQMVQFVLRAFMTMFPDEHIENPEHEEFANNILRLDCEDFIHILRIVDESFIRKLQRLWSEETAIQKAYHHRHKYQLPVEELPELIKQMDQIFNIPKTKHVMSSYVKTTGIVETECFYRNTQLRIFDTGGQRNERKKWVHLFSSTSAIVFIVSLSEYNQVCYEDDKSNRMKESLLLFEEIVNACCFEDVPIFLVFNKKDVFLNKIQYFDISEAFPDLPNHIRLRTPINNLHKLAGEAKKKHIANKKKRAMPGSRESSHTPKTLERFQRARSASIQKQQRKQSNLMPSNSFLPRMSPSRFVNENHHMLTEEEEFKIRQENWQKIPSDILIYICFFLDAAELCVLSTVNYEMYIIATCDTVWRSLCYSYMREIDEEQVDLLYKERYHLFEPNITGKMEESPTTTTTLSLKSSLQSLTSSMSCSSDHSPSSSSKAISIGSTGINQKDTPILTLPITNNQFRTSTYSIVSDTSNSSDEDASNNLISFEEREFKKRKWRFFYEIGGYVYRDSMKYIQTQFIELAKSESRRDQLWRDVRVTSATNAPVIRELLEYVFDTIIESGEPQIDMEFDESPRKSSKKTKKSKPKYH